LWGTGSLSRSREKGPSFVGLINKKRVSFEELYESLVAIRSQIILNYFNQQQLFDALLKNKPLLAKLAWDRLIMVRETKTYKIKIPDTSVIDYIRSHPIFSRNGQFDERLYEYILRYNIGLGPRGFEEAIRQNMAIQRLKDIVTKDIKVTDEELLNEYKKESEKFDEEKFKKERGEFAKKYIEKKKSKALDDWFAKISLKTSLKINLEDYEKYYR
jgi:hypothetical protein